MSELTVKNLSVRYVPCGGGALNNVSFSVKKGEFVGIVGPNGGGKTTLLKAILSLIPYQGEISNSIGKIAYVPQYGNMERSFPITALEVVASGFVSGKIRPFGKPDLKRALPFLEETGIAHLKDRLPDELSGGEFQRLLISRALASGGKVLLLDEPTASVDPVHRKEMNALFERKRREGMTIVMVSHNMEGLSPDRLLFIDRSLRSYDN